MWHHLKEDMEMEELHFVVETSCIRSSVWSFYKEILCHISSHLWDMDSQNFLCDENFRLQKGFKYVKYTSVFSKLNVFERITRYIFGLIFNQIILKLYKYKLVDILPGNQIG